jgi:Flp pilus assembly secretin CpaC/tetratricopeptide (TPR) repeat protein
MIKAATTTLSVMLVLGTATPLLGQQPLPGQFAGEEAVRRQAAKVQLRKTIEAAQKAQARQDLAGAAKLYEEALDAIEKIGIGVDRERNETIAGFSAVRLRLADEAQKRGNLEEASKQVNRVVRVDPQNAAAQKLKANIDKTIEDRRGKVASKEVQDRVSAIKEERIGTDILVQDARLLIEMGRLDEADAKLKQAVKQDPEATTAFYYQSYIKEARHAQQSRLREMTSKDKMLKVEEAWNIPITRDRLPAANPFATTNLVHTSPQRQRIYQKLERIILNEVFYDGIPLSEVIKDLSQEVKKRDPDRRGLNFIINSAIDIPAPPIQLGAIDPVTGQPLAPTTTAEPVDLNNVIIRLNPPLTDMRLVDVIDAITKVADRALKYSVEDYAIVFTQKSAELPALFTRIFKVDPNTFYEGLQSVSIGTLGAGGQQGGGGLGGGGLGGGGGGGLGGGGGGGVGGGFTYPRVDLSGGAALGLGGGGGGLGGGGLGGGGLGGGGLGGGGLGGGGLGGGGGGLGGGVGIQGITTLGSKAVYSQMVRDFFNQLGLNFPTNNAAGGFGAGGAPGFPPGPGVAPAGATRALFFNDRAGLIYARATMEELDIMEQAIQVLNAIPPQVNIEAKFTEITQSDSKALGFDWFIGNTLLNKGSLGVVAGDAPSYSGNPSAANPLGTFPGIPPGADPGNPLGTTLPSSFSNQKLTGGLGNVVGADRRAVPAVATVTGILTDPQFRVVIRAMEQRSGIDVLSVPSVTTLSGRQAKLEVTELRTIVASAQVGQTAAGGGGGALGGGLGGGGAAIGAQAGFTPQSVPTGPALDVVPYVSADGYSIQMTLMPSLVEFLGYDDPGPFIPQAQSAAGNTLGTPLTAVLPLPKFRLRQVVSSVNVWDGQTVVLGGLIAEDVAKIKDKVPVLGDIPLLGRFFRSESMATSKKNLVIFITPTLIDPAGNRIHTEDNLPYDPNVIPRQPLAPPPAAP